MIVIAIMAVIAGADGPKAIGTWAVSNEKWLRERLELPGGIPSHDTIGRVLMSLKSSAFQTCFQNWIAPLMNRHCDLEADITIDAAGCQKKIADSIIRGKADYVLALKGNQGKLHQSVVEYIEEAMENDFVTVACRKYKERMKGHGRTDEIIYYQFNVPDKILVHHHWKGLRTIGVAIRHSKSSKGESDEVRYFISSLPLSVKRFAACVRGHWGIENTLHWCLDVTFREDESRVRERVLADILAWLKRFAISLLKQVPDKESIAMRRRMAGWNSNYLAKVLGIPT
jgi:predicted transposase YbfD/YdcC